MVVDVRWLLLVVGIIGCSYQERQVFGPPTAPCSQGIPATWSPFIAEAVRNPEFSLSKRWSVPGNSYEVSPHGVSGSPSRFLDDNFPCFSLPLNHSYLPTIPNSSKMTQHLKTAENTADEITDVLHSWLIHSAVLPSCECPCHFR